MKDVESRYNIELYVKMSLVPNKCLYLVIQGDFLSLPKRRLVTEVLRRVLTCGIKAVQVNAVNEKVIDVVLPPDADIGGFFNAFADFMRRENDAEKSAEEN